MLLALTNGSRYGIGTSLAGMIGAVLALVRGDACFGEAGVQDTAQALGLKFIFVARLTQKVQSLCRHDDARWQRTEIPGLEVQKWNWTGRVAD